MALDFPNAPVIGQLFPVTPAPGMPQWQWDGTLWTAAGILLAGAIRYDVAQALNATQVQQARSNIGMPIGQIPANIGITQPGPGCVGEKVFSTGNSLTFSASGSSGVVSTLILGVGIWDVEGYNDFGGPGAVSSSDWITTIGTLAGAIGGGSLISAAHTRRPSAADVSEHHVLSRVRVALNAQTTYYMNAQATYSAAGFACTGLCWGTRV